MQAEGLIFTEKYKECQKPRIVTDMAVKFSPVAAGKSKPLVAPKTQKSRRNAEIPAMIPNQPDSVILDTVWGRRGADSRNVDYLGILSDPEYMVEVKEKLRLIMNKKPLSI